MTLDTRGCDSEWSRELRKQVDKVYAADHALVDHRKRFPWLEGFLGNAYAPVWFVAWYPSTTAVSSIHSATATCEAQWLATGGDRIFRQNLCDFGLKAGRLDEPGGWNCYITDLIKADEVPKAFGTYSLQQRMTLYSRWLPVLEWEFANGKSECVVSIGSDVRRYLDDLWPQLVRARGRSMRRAHVWHYAFFNRGGDTPANRATYRRQFETVLRSCA